MIDRMKQRYVMLFGEEPSDPDALPRIAQELGISFPDDFQQVSTFYRGGMVGGVSHYSIAAVGPADNICRETLRLRAAVGLPSPYVVLAEPPESLILMNVEASVGGPGVIWCDAHDVSRLSTPLHLRRPQTWPTYADFFQFLLDAETDERAEA